MDLYTDLGQVAMMSRGGIWEGREPVLAAVPAVPGDRAGLWEGCAGEFLVCFSLQEQLFQAYLGYDHNERGFPGGHTSPGGVVLDS